MLRLCLLQIINTTFFPRREESNATQTFNGDTSRLDIALHFIFYPTVHSLCGQSQTHCPRLILFYLILIPSGYYLLKCAEWQSKVSLVFWRTWSFRGQKANGESIYTDIYIAPITRASMKMSTLFWRQIWDCCFLQALIRSVACRADVCERVC